MTDNIKVKRNQKYTNNKGEVFKVYSIKMDFVAFHIGNRVYKDKVKCIFLETNETKLTSKFSLERFIELIENNEYTLTP